MNVLDSLFLIWCSATNCGPFFFFLVECALPTCELTPQIRKIQVIQRKIRITEQPANLFRFRYASDRKRFISLPGSNSTPEMKTFPSIDILGYEGVAAVVISCVTKDGENGRYKPHPHSLLAKGDVEVQNGVYAMKVNIERHKRKIEFKDLRIQRVRKNDIPAALKQRRQINVNPFQSKKPFISIKYIKFTLFTASYPKDYTEVDVNVVRLCFQVFVKDNSGNLRIPLNPVVTEPIYCQKPVIETINIELSNDSGFISGGETIVLLCDKVDKEDIEIIFLEKDTNWEGKGLFEVTDVHRNCAIKFKTPPYHTKSINEPVHVRSKLY